MKSRLPKRWKSWIGIVIVLVGLVIIYRVVSEGKEETKTTGENGRIELVQARAEQSLDNRFSFPLKDGDGEEVSRVEILIDKAEIRDEIIVKGKKVTSVKGRTFMVLNLKIKNEYDKTIQVNSRDYIRLSVNGNEEVWLAPDVHNDPVEVQAISTKPTRVAFPIDEGDSRFVLQVGEVNGEKDRIELNI